YLAVQLCDGAFARAGIFNWVPPSAVAEDRVICHSPAPLRVSQMSVEDFGLDTMSGDVDPEFILKDDGAEIRGGIYFPRRRFPPQVMIRLAKNFILCIRQLVQSPEVQLAELDLV